MTDGEYSLLMLVALLAACTIYLVAVVRNQKRTIATLTASPAASVADPQLAQKDREIQELRDRVQVLERITVDNENSVAREIEALRDR